MKTAIALGTFDGVHYGHKQVLSLAAENEFSVALVFSLPPKAYFLNKGIALSDANIKKELILSLGIKKVEFLEFLKVKDIPAEEFFNELINKYNPKKVYCGENYSFGKNGAGDINLLKTLCQKNNIELVVVPFVRAGGEIISSSVIRNLLKEGEVNKANSLMVSPFSFTAPVTEGDKRGRTIGFPTINQPYPKENAEVKFGVYSSCVFINGKEYKSITNVGIRPTYQTKEVYAETYIIGFNGDLYGKEIRVYLKEFLREEKKFSSLSELKETIKSDLEKIKK